MEKSTLVFDKRQRKLISDEIRGIRDGSIAVVNYPAKIQEILHEWEIETEKDTIVQQMYWATNNQDTFRGAYQVLLAERPEQLKNLFSGFPLMSLEPVHGLPGTIQFFNKADNKPSVVLEA